MDTNLQDPAEPILSGDPALDQDTRGNLWDAFHNSKDPNELSRVLEPYAIPDDTKRRLLAAKQQATPLSASNPAATAIDALSSIPQNSLDAAESHPNVLKALIEGMKTPEQAGGETPEIKKPALTPRPDGQKHFKPIPEGHYRILSSDGGIHDIPVANIDIARRIDPLLHVLNA